MFYPFEGHNVPDETIPEESIEVRPSEELGQTSDASQIAQLNLRADIAKSDHDNLHKIIQQLLQTSGLLLTVSLGAIYFSYTTTAEIKLPLCTKGFLFGSAFFLSAAVLYSVHPLHLPSRSSFYGIDLAEKLENVYDEEQPYADKASYCLGCAVWCLILALVVFFTFRFWDFLNSGILSTLENASHISHIIVTIT